jgi:predicted enzyme related to lactoylglutathione lyase
VEVTCVTVDCADPRRAVDFWAGALGWQVVHAGADGAYCAPADGGGLGLEFVRVAEPKVAKNRVHLGTRTDDIDGEVARLVALGATVAWEEEFPAGWPYRNVVLRDPEGNEFCLGNEPRHR